MAMPTLTVLSHGDVMRLVSHQAAIDVLAEGFKALSLGHVQAPPRPKVDIPGKGISLAMLAWMPGHAISLKTVNVFHDNAKLGLESHQALISLFDGDTGVPIAVVDGASVTGMRTAAAAVLSTRLAARETARIATVVGGGVQAREHVACLGLARPFDEIRVFARSDSAAAAAARMSPKAVVVRDLAAAVRTSDVVCLTTSSESAVIETAWLRPGTHVTSVGFAPPGSELPLDLIDKARIMVEAKSAFEPAPVGCAELAGKSLGTAAELGEVLLGRKPARSSDTEITLYKSMGNAMEDMVVANLAYRLAMKSGAGQKIGL